MIWLLSVGVVALTFVVVVSSAALVEVFRQLAELRGALNINDEPIPLGLKAGERRTDEIGLPPGLAVEPKAIVMFLSTKCATCLKRRRRLTLLIDASTTHRDYRRPI